MRQIYSTERDQQVSGKKERRREEDTVIAIREGRAPRSFRKFHPHTLRHTFATRCFEKRMEPKVVQKLMGHSNISITMNIYTHVLDNMMDSELEKFGFANTENREDIDTMSRDKITSRSHT